MSRYHHDTYRSAVVALVIAVAVIALCGVMSAQSDETPKAEFFIGYQWLNPGVNVPRVDASGDTVSFKLPSMADGFGSSFAYNFRKYAALELDYGQNWGDHANVISASVGPKFTYRGDGVNFFAHFLAGPTRLNSIGDSPSWVLSPIVGGGMDLRITRQFSWRVFQADFVWAHYKFDDLDGARLRTGLVFNFGGEAPEEPATAACSVENPEVMVGEPVRVSVTASHFNPKHTLSYTWSASGGKIEGKDTAATIDTNGVAGGSYTATATVTDAKAKKNNTASCTANFTVKEPPKNPPQMSCSANPSSVMAGNPSTITCTCTSPDNVPVTVSGWSASGGSISGSGNTATLTTTPNVGAPPQTINVSATCTDSRGLSTSASTSVTAENPPAPKPQASKLNECEYPNAKKPWRVDNTCKAALDDVAAKLQQDPDAKLVVVGNATPKEKRKNLAAERAADVKFYLTEGEAQQHIDASRIECRTGNEGTGTTEQWIVPAGAPFPEADSTTPVDETKVKPIPDHPKPAAKKAAKKAQ
jgi:outer membrane protein OmpA-like peptidoglycan-associated protein